MGTTTESRQDMWPPYRLPLRRSIRSARARPRLSHLEQAGLPRASRDLPGPFMAGSGDDDEHDAQDRRVDEARPRTDPPTSRQRRDRSIDGHEAKNQEREQRGHSKPRQPVATAIRALDLRDVENERSVEPAGEQAENRQRHDRTPPLPRQPCKACNKKP